MSDTGGTGGTAEVREVAIVGSGPAGYTAAIYCARAGLRPLVFEGALEPGGALINTTDVENYPGFPDGVLGPELMQMMRAQAARFDAEFVTDDVTSVDLGREVKVLRVRGTEYRARSVILALGSRYRELGVPGEKRLAARGVSYCATCDGAFFRDEDIVVVGGGDSAMEEATYLTRFARTVTVVHRRDTLRASQIMQARATANPKISFAWNSEVVEILGGEAVESVVLRDVMSGERRPVAVTGVFVAVGHEPRTEIVSDQLALAPTGHIVVAAPSAHTSLEGVFACGDAIDAVYMQAVTAAGTGCAAAIDAERWLAAKDPAALAEAVI